MTQSKKELVGQVKHVKLFGLCVVAVFALLAVALAGSASAAEPEWGRCVSVKSKGHYEDGNCTKEDFKENKAHEKKYKGKFEWLPGAQSDCVAQKKGKYKDAGCTELDEKNGKAKGKFEKTGGGKFEGNGGAGVLQEEFFECELANGKTTPVKGPHSQCTGELYGFHAVIREIHIECSKEHATGEAVGAAEVANVKVTFTGCNFSGIPANSPGAPAGEIRTNTLKGRLGYIHKATHEVGVLLGPATPGELFAEVELPEVELLIHVGVGSATEGAFYEEANGAPTGNDGIISPITPVNQMTPTFTQNYRTETIEPYEPVSCPVSHTCPLGDKTVGGQPVQDLLNIPSHLEGGPLEALEEWQNNTGEPPYEGCGCSTQWSPASEEITNVNTVEGQAEIKG